MVNGWMGWWVDVLVDGWVDGWVHGWVGEWVDGFVEGVWMGGGRACVGYVWVSGGMEGCADSLGAGVAPVVHS